MASARKKSVIWMSSKLSAVSGKQSLREQRQFNFLTRLGSGTTSLNWTERHGSNRCFLRLLSYLHFYKYFIYWIWMRKWETDHATAESSVTGELVFLCWLSSECMQRHMAVTAEGATVHWLPTAPSCLILFCFISAQSSTWNNITYWIRNIQIFLQGILYIQGIWLGLWWRYKSAARDVSV